MHRKLKLHEVTFVRGLRAWTAEHPLGNRLSELGFMVWFVETVASARDKHDVDRIALQAFYAFRVLG